MGYNKKIWQTGDTITDIALNNIENGILTVDSSLTSLASNKSTSTNGQVLTANGDGTASFKDATGGSASTASVIWNKNKLVITGDSITEMNKSGKGLGITSAKGYIDWGNLLCNHYFNVLNNDGVSGDKTTGVLSRFDANVLSYKPDFIHVMIGVNDVGATGATATGIIANLTQIYTKALNSGAVLIVGTITTNSTFTTAQQVILTTVNGWIRNYARNNCNVILADYYAYVVDSTTGLVKTGITTDGIHPSNSMAYMMGVCFRNAVTPYIKQKSFTSGFAVDANNILTNSAFNGTTTPTSWTVSGTNTKAIVPATDYMDSKYLSVDITSGNYVQMSQSVKLSDGKVSVGDTVFASIQVDIASMTSFNEMCLKLEVYNDSFAILAKTYEFSDVETVYFDLANFSATLVTDKIVVPTGSANVSFVSKVTGIGNVKFRNPCIIKC
jgi:lysophospholipase L1-like esterase